MGATVTLSGATSVTTTTDATGRYAFPSTINGTYKVTPSNPGATFTPPSQIITVAGADLVVPSFTSVQPTVVVSGVITGTGGSGATVSLSGTASATTTASSTGAYSFPAVVNGSYVVTPANPGYVFSPVNRSVTVAGKNIVASFSATAQTYTISGVLSGPLVSGATVTLRGSVSKSVTASSTGAFTFSGLTNGSYTVTPTMSGAVFTPASQTVVVSGSNMTANFVATARFHSITGVISGAGGVGATVSLAGTAVATTTASSTGSYSFSGLVSGPYRLTVVNTGYTFTPTTASITLTTTDATANFSATPLLISGTIAGLGGPFATVTLTGSASATTTASASGAYSFGPLAQGTYTYTPSNTGFTFTPASRTATLTTAGKLTENFSTVTYIVAGTISGASGAGATVQLVGANSTVTTTASASGAYRFTNVKNGAYTVIPVSAQAGAVFTPASKAITVNQASVAVNFAGNP